MTILIVFHQAQYRNFKAFYLGYVRRHLKRDLPHWVSYKRFVALMRRIGVPLFVYLRVCMGHCTGVSFVDSTPLRMCHYRHIGRHQVFAGWAARGKTTMDWFYGFKLHLVVNDRGELISMQLAPGNVDDPKPLPQLTDRLYRKLLGGNGYLSQALHNELREQGVDLLSSLRRNMRPH